MWKDFKEYFDEELRNYLPDCEAGKGRDVCFPVLDFLLCYECAK